MRPTALLAVALAVAWAGCVAPSASVAQGEPDPFGPDAAQAPPTPVEKLAAPRDARAWPDLAAATVRPGVGVESLVSYTEALGAGCTSNFVFTDQHGRLYLGSASHCFDEAATVGGGGRCEARPMPTGTEVHVDGATRPGRLAYTSTEAMARLGTADEGACASNDFALVEIDPADGARVHPAVLGFGGPTAVAAAVDAGATVRTVGASPYRPGPALLDQAEGSVEETRSGGWAHSVRFMPQRIPGDSGSPVVARDGTAVGLVGSLAVGGENGVLDLRLVLDFARRATGLDLRLATWDLLEA